VRIFVTVAGDQPYHDAQREYVMSLAAADEVGTHELADDVADADALLFVDLQQHPADTFLRVLRHHPLVRSHAGKVYVYDERDCPFVSFPGIYVSATPALARRHPVVGGPYPALPTRTRPEPRAPDLLFSFAGARTHPVRDAVLRLTHPRGLVRDTSATNFFGWVGSERDHDEAAGRAEYERTIARSKFVLCPRGHSPSSFRLYETLSAGRVPVVISDGWLPPPRIDWEACAVRVRERDVLTIPALLERLEPRWTEMARAGARAFDDHFASQRLWNHYGDSLEQLALCRTRRPWWLQRQVARLAVRHVRLRAYRAELARLEAAKRDQDL